MSEKTCHGCGLEDADECPTQHLPSLQTFPCEKCLRNPEVMKAVESVTQVKDRWNECWAIDAENKPFIER